MQRKILIITAVFLFTTIFTSLVGAESTYEQQKNSLNPLLNEIKERQDEIKNQELPKIRAELKEFAKIKQKNIKEHTQAASEARNEDERDGYLNIVEFDKIFLNLINNNLQRGFTQLNESSKSYIEQIDSKYDLNWHGAGLPTLEKLAAIHFLKFEYEKLEELEIMIENNDVNGITERAWYDLNEDLDKRWNRKSSDPGDYWGGVEYSNFEKPVYDELRNLNKEFNMLTPRKQEELMRQSSDDHSEDNYLYQNRVVYPNGMALSLDMVKGKGVYIYRDGEKINIANKDFRLKVGDRIYCDKDSMAVMQMGKFDGGDAPHLLQVYPSSALTIGEKRPEVKTGFIRTMVDKVKELFGQKEMEIETPSSIAGIRGTDFLTFVDDDGNSVFFLYEGEIILKSKEFNQELILKPGQKVIVFNDGYIHEAEAMTAEDLELFKYDLSEIF